MLLLVVVVVVVMVGIQQAREIYRGVLTRNVLVRTDGGVLTGKHIGKE